jgi:hypothetical protein
MTDDLTAYETVQWNGVRVYLTVSLTEAGEPMQVVRSWRERLLSWPWRPWIRCKTVTPQRPYRGALNMKGGLVMHPLTFMALKEATKEERTR